MKQLRGFGAGEQGCGTHYRTMLRQPAPYRIGRLRCKISVDGLLRLSAFSAAFHVPDKGGEWIFSGHFVEKIAMPNRRSFVAHDLINFVVRRFSPRVLLDVLFRCLAVERVQKFGQGRFPA